LTSLKPGALAPGGRGVDIKHNSYARYLNSKKAVNVKTQTKQIAAAPKQGNKTYSISMIQGSAQCCP
jgi:hypothetical protein